MSYDEAIETTVSRKSAQREIANHSADWNEFVAEYGDNDQYDGGDVLGWLGY